MPEFISVKSKSVEKPLEKVGQDEDEEVLQRGFGQQEYSDEILQTYTTAKNCHEEKIYPQNVKPTTQTTQGQDQDAKSKTLMTFMLEKQMILTVVSPFEGELRVDIRYLNEELRRTRKGLSLPIPQFKMLVENIGLFDETFKKMRDDLLP